jgi:hypothetical protein
MNAIEEQLLANTQTMEETAEDERINNFKQRSKQSSSLTCPYCGIKRT